MIASKSFAVVRDRDSLTKCFYSIFFPSLKKYFCIPWKLSPPKRPVCLVGRLWRKKKKARRRRWKSPIASRELSVFRSLPFLLGYPTGASAEERALETIKKNCLHGGSMVTTLVAICYTRFCHFQPFLFTKHAKGSKIHNYTSWLRWLNTVFWIAFNTPYPEEIRGQ